MPEARELLYTWSHECLAVLVPKQRGVGFLKVPYGDHNDPALNHVADAAGCDLFGKDGALEFQCGGQVYHGGCTAHAAFEAQVIPALEAHYGWRARAIPSHEFWALHPTFPGGR